MRSRNFSTTGERRPIGDVEISLRKLGETDESINGAEAAAKVSAPVRFSSTMMSRSLRPGDSRIFRVSFDFGKVAKVLETLLATPPPASVSKTSPGVTSISRRITLSLVRALPVMLTR